MTSLLRSPDVKEAIASAVESLGIPSELVFRKFHLTGSLVVRSLLSALLGDDKGHVDTVANDLHLNLFTREEVDELLLTGFITAPHVDETPSSTRFLDNFEGRLRRSVRSFRCGLLDVNVFLLRGSLEDFLSGGESSLSDHIVWDPSQDGLLFDPDVLKRSLCPLTEKVTSPPADAPPADTPADAPPADTPPADTPPTVSGTPGIPTVPQELHPLSELRLPSAGVLPASELTPSDDDVPAVTLDAASAAPAVPTVFRRRRVIHK